MNLFYGPDIKGSTIRLTFDESHHCINVLRHHKGDRIMITDGTGSFFEAIIVNDDPKSCSAEIITREPFRQYMPCNIHIAVAPTKQINRFEWFLEKSTELGIATITPLICERSERRTIKTDRLKKVVLSAMKQSFSSFLPELREPVALTSFLETTENIQAVKCIGHCAESEKHQLKDIYHAGSDAIILIGPEGDFSPVEVTLALQMGFIPITLSANRLRTETAALVACHAIHLLNEAGSQVNDQEKCV